jgi:hypothetical protein
MNGSHDEKRTLENSIPGDEERHDDSLRVMVGRIISELEAFLAFNSNMTMSFHPVFDRFLPQMLIFRHCPL